MIGSFNMANILLSMILLTLLVLIIIKLYSRMKQTNLSNLNWLILAFLATSSLGFFKMFARAFRPLEIGFNISEMIVLISIIMFTKETFYKRRQSSFPYVLIVTTGLSISCIITSVFRILTNETSIYLLELYLLAVSIITASIWLTSVSFSSLNVIKDDDIDKNIKLRYTFIGISAIFLAIQGFIIPFNGLFTTFLVNYRTEYYSIVNLILSLGFGFGQFYSWVILGRKIEQSKAKPTPEDDISEEEMMKILNKGE